MNCKYCDEPLIEGKPFCPSCGKPVNDEEQAPVQETSQGPEIVEEKAGTGKIALTVGAVVVVVALLAAAILSSLGLLKPLGGSGETIAPTAGMLETVETVPATIPPDGNPDDVTCKGTYTDTDDEVVAARSTVVATMGDKELTVEQLQVYYWMEFYYFMQNYGNFVSYFGLDITQPMDTQICGISEETMTWQQYFLNCALESWQTYQAMALEAEAAGLELDEDTRKTLDELAVNMDTIAQTNGYADASNWIATDFGAGATPQGYLDHFEVYYQFWTYYNDQSEKAIPTAEEVDAYFAENETYYTENGITKESGSYYDVRHILIVPEGGTYNAETGLTDYTDEEWAAAMTKAQEILDQWLAGDKTEESFAALANEFSKDSDGTDGGLYTKLTVDTNFVENFKNWYLEEGRKNGDYEIVQTEYGYHIMYFSDSYEIWYSAVETDMVNARLTEVMTSAREAHPAEIDYSAILLATLNLG